MRSVPDLHCLQYAHNQQRSLTPKSGAYNPIRDESAYSVPTSNLVCIKMASILKSQARDPKHGGTISNRHHSFDEISSDIERSS